MHEPEATTPPTTPAAHARVERLIRFFESLSPQRLGELGSIYTPNAYFKDPFNEVRGLAEIRAIFEHMYVALEKPCFVVTGTVAQDDECFVTWNFEFHMKAWDRQTLQTIRGTSHLKFTTDGLVDYHRDYWDAAEELYEKLPVVGSLMRWLKKRANS